MLLSQLLYVTYRMSYSLLWFPTLHSSWQGTHFPAKKMQQWIYAHIFTGVTMFFIILKQLAGQRGGMAFEESVTV